MTRCTHLVPTTPLPYYLLQFILPPFALVAQRVKSHPGVQMRPDYASRLATPVDDVTGLRCLHFLLTPTLHTLPLRQPPAVPAATTDDVCLLHLHTRARAQTHWPRCSVTWRVFVCPPPGLP